MVAAAIKLTDPSKNRYGFSFRGGAGANGVPDTIIQNYNCDNIDHDDSMFLKDGKTMFSTPEAKQALELYVKLYKEGSPKDSINWGFQEQVQAFTSGVTGMLLQDPDVIPSLTEKMDDQHHRHGSDAERTERQSVDRHRRSGLGHRRDTRSIRTRHSS